MQRLLLAFLLAALPAQVVTISNSGPVPFDGWVRCTVDITPPHNTGVVTTSAGVVYPFILGRMTGFDTHALDVRVRLVAGERLTLQLGKGSQAADIVRAPLPAQSDWLGGLVTLGGSKLSKLSQEPDGAGYLIHWRGRLSKMLCADLWVHYIADQPWARAEILVTCSNPAVPDLGQAIPKGLVLRCGDAVVLVPGRKVGDVLIDAGTWLGDGQARALPVTLLWTRAVDSAVDWSSIGALDYVAAAGIRKLWPHGNPRVASDLDPVTWARDRMPEAVRRLHTFEKPQLGPNPRSGDTGAQADQTFVGGEATVGEAAVRLLYLNALRVSNRPCHHLEANGEQLSLDSHPDLAMWDSRPHVPFFPDALGKDYSSGWPQTSGWTGADVEHWFHNNLMAATRLTGSSAGQWLLSAQARVYPYQSTARLDDPRFIYHNMPFASRAVGWEGIMAVHLWVNLEDRELAQQTKLHWLDRATKVLVPQLSAREGDVWDWMRDDRLGPGLRYIPWQQALGSYGFDLAGEILGHTAARDVALRAAKRVVHDSWWKTKEGYWLCRDVIAQDGAEVPSGGYGGYFGNALGVATMLRHDAASEPARSIWTQLVREASSVTDFVWLAPGVR